MDYVQAALYADFLGTPSYFWLIFISIVIAGGLLAGCGDDDDSDSAATTVAAAAATEAAATEAVETEAAASRRYYDAHHRVLFHDIVRSEQEDGRRIRFERDGAIGVGSGRHRRAVAPVNGKRVRLNHRRRADAFD